MSLTFESVSFWNVMSDSLLEVGVEFGRVPGAQNAIHFVGCQGGVENVSQLLVPRRC